jgi:hypothetical protein
MENEELKPDIKPDGKPNIKPEAPIDDKPVVPQWAQKRFSELSKQVHAQKDQNARLAQENAALAARLKTPAGAPAQQPQPAPAQPAATQQQIDEFVRSEAARLAADTEFTNRCNDIFEAGKKEFPDDWKEQLGQFSNLAGLPTHFVEAAFEVGDAHKILYHLSKDLDEAQRLFEMRPVKLAVELERLNRKLNARKVPSKAPPPIDTIEGGKGSGAAKNPEEMSSAEWHAWRAQDLAAKRAQREAMR